MPQQYIYKGDKLTADFWKGKACTAVLNEIGKCIRGRNGSMLVEFDDGTKSVIIGRLLRKIKP
jgi:hypothetical protein